MKRVLQFLALALALGGTGLWLVAGANRGWTKTSVEKKVLDEVTGIDGITYDVAFKPGLDFLGAILLGATVLTGASLMIRKKTASNSTP